MAVQFSKDGRKAWRIWPNGRELCISIAEALWLIDRGVREVK